MTRDALPISSPTSAELRIFISSTFRDLQEEREHLVKKIFPEIRDLCRLRGVELTEVDLRWGIAEDESRPGRIIRTCLEEIDRCRPFFIGIVGDRFGWVPPPEVLEEDPSLIESYPWLEQIIAEGRSITEIEFLYAALPSFSSASSALFYRRATGDGAGEREQLDRMVDTTERAGYHVEEFRDPESLGRMIRNELIALVERRWPIDRLPAPLELERRKHEAFASTRRRAYIPNPRYLERFRAFVERSRSDGDGGAGLVIQAGSGTGKSSLISWLAAHLAEIDPAAFAITHFIGAGSSDGDQTEVIRRIMSEIRERFDIAEELPTEPAELERELPAWLARARSPVVIFIDALDQLRVDRRGLAWLPRFLPANITVVASTTGGESLDALRDRGWEEIVVEPLDVQERGALIARFLGAYRKRLHPGLARRIAADPKCAIPLFLRTVLEELRLFGEHERLEEITEYYLDAPDLSMLFQRVLERMERDFGSAFVREIMTLLAVSRRGLTETELIELAGATRVELSEILHALDYHLFRRQGRLDFFHAWLRRAVEERYLQDESTTQQMHLRLAEHFRRGPASARLAEELPWQLQKGGDLKGLRDAVGDLDLFPFLATEEMRYELLGYWRLLKEQYDIVEIYRESIERYAAQQSDELSIAEAIDGVWEMLELARYFDGAEPMLARSLEIRQRLRGEEDSLTARSLRNLGALNVLLGDFSKAETLFQQSLRTYETTRGMQDEATLSVLEALATLYYQRGDIKASEPLLRRAMEARIELYGAEDPATAESAGNLGAAVFGIGKLEESEELLGQALMITEGAYGMNHLSTATRLNNLGVLQLALSRFDTAGSYFQRALRINEQLLGPWHPETASNVLNLGSVYKQQKEYEKAEELYRRAITIKRQVYGNRHIDITNTLISLGVLLWEKGDCDAAATTTQEAFDILSTVLGDEHRLTADAALQLAGILLDQQRYGDAEKLYLKFLPLREKQLGATHSQTLRSKKLYASLLRMTGRTAEAEALDS